MFILLNLILPTSITIHFALAKALKGISMKLFPHTSGRCTFEGLSLIRRTWKTLPPKKNELHRRDFSNADRDKLAEMTRDRSSVSHD